MLKKICLGVCIVILIILALDLLDFSFSDNDEDIYTIGAEIKEKPSINSVIIKWAFGAFLVVPIILLSWMNFEDKTKFVGLFIFVLLFSLFSRAFLDHPGLIGVPTVGLFFVGFFAKKADLY